MPCPSDPLIARIRDGVIGERRAIATPFGLRPLVYADYVASGRALDFIEEAVRTAVLPLYANTHTETSQTGAHTTALRNAARAAIRDAVGADAGHAVIFCGAGATGAVDKLVRAMGLHRAIPGRRPVVFVGPYEHHSNDLPWREAAVEIVRIPLDAEGGVCLRTLAEALAATEGAPRRIGAFSAASNVTGVRTDLTAIARLLHAHGALLVADFAAGGPYLPIRMAESAPGAGDRIDAAFLSPHKFVGGPGASGVLVADRGLLAAAVPSVPGGGTVSYVTHDHHAYVTDPERREEAGTPNVVGDIRAGLALRLKARVGAEAIAAREAAMVARAMAAWAAVPGIEVLGPAKADRFGVFALNIRHSARHLHHNFVVALLNDLFGIQARGGCSCAGPYGHALLGIDDARAAAHEAAVQRGLSVMRPGWARLGFNFFFDDATVDYIIAAVAFVARHGAAFLPRYRLDPATGVWRAGLAEMAPTLDALLDGQWPAALPAPGLDNLLAEAVRLAAEPVPAAPPTRLDAQAEALRWFWLPHETTGPLECVA